MNDKDAQSNQLNTSINDSSEDIGVNIEFIGETYEIMEGVMFKKGTKSWLPTDEWEKIKDEMCDWKVI